MPSELVESSSRARALAATGRISNADRYSVSALRTGLESRAWKRRSIAKKTRRFAANETSNYIMSNSQVVENDGNWIAPSGVRVVSRGARAHHLVAGSLQLRRPGSDRFHVER